METTVLDLTRLLPGGYCSLLLAELGADVIKVEEPERGDYIRWVPPFVDGESTAHRALNRGKRSITLNLKSEEGAGILGRLASSADVLVESFRPGVMERLGLGWRELSRGNAGLVYCAITGYGQDGPYRHRVGHDLNYIGYGGVLSLTGPVDGIPAIPGVQIGDLAGGMFGAIGVLAALLDRRSTGQGRFVDVSMLDGIVSWLTIHVGAFLATGEEPGASRGPLSGGYACYRLYRTKEGRHVTVAALEPRFWRALCETLDCPDLIDGQFGSPGEQERMAGRLQEIFLTRTRKEWLKAFEDVPACVGPVNDLGEALADPQVRHRGMVTEIGGMPVGPGPALKMSPVVSGAAPLRQAPRLGEHTAEVLAGAGVDEATLAELRSRGVA